MRIPNTGNPRRQRALRFNNPMNVATMLDRHKALVVASAAAVPLLVCGVLALFRDGVTAAAAVLVLVLAVVAAASTGIRLAGIAAAVSSGLWFDFFLTEPYGRLTIDDRSDVEAAVLLVIIGAAVTEIALWGHRQQERAARRSGYLDGVLGTAEIVTLRDEAPEALVAHVGRQIRQVLGVDGVRFVSGPVHDPRIPILDHQGLVSRQGHPLNVDRDGLPFDDETALLVTQGAVPVGHFLLTAAADIARPSLEQRRVAVLLADQLSSVHLDPRR